MVGADDRAGKRARHPEILRHLLQYSRQLLRNNRPDLYKRAYKIQTAACYPRMKLTGKAVIDYSNASLLGICFDIRKKRWDEKLVESVKRQRAVCDLFPEAQSSKCFASLARRVLESERDTRVKGNIQFFFRQKFAPALGLEML